MYDEIADLYHLIYENWDDAIRRQAAGLNRIIGEALGAESGLAILDVSCGIGTQALGLAALGHRVTASDLSAASVRRAEREAATRNLDLRLSVADMRQCCAVHGDGFDVVLTCDNSLPHLQTVADIRSTLREMYACLEPGGLGLIGLRDYANIPTRGEHEVWTYGRRVEGTSRYVVFQTRDWFGDHYDVGMYFVREAADGSPASVTSGTSRYYAIEVDEVMAILREVGFEKVDRREETLYQPVITGIKGGG